MKIPVTSFLLLGMLLLVSSCSLDNFSPAGTLSPPMVLRLSITNGSQIAVSFQGLNNEYYFLGYNIYLGANDAEVTNRLYPLTNAAAPYSGTLPTLRQSAFEINATFTFIISNNTSGAFGGGGLSGTVHVGAGAYGNDGGEIVYSPVVVVSNITP